MILNCTQFQCITAPHSCITKSLPTEKDRKNTTYEAYQHCTEYSRGSRNLDIHNTVPKTITQCNSKPPKPVAPKMQQSPNLKR
eukprot:1440479-Amphidinium_carterae.5